ncbi:MAG: GNAT family N-acetyltransferase [Candidatus Lokiarchaeota archaeon]|nr:GNAT family N-acetyltransferase [Candidatus Lokiarchaeota archaeon]
MKTPHRLETKRLILKPYSEEDINEFLDSYKIAEPGFSLVISNKENDNYLGTCGLNPIRDSNGVGCVYALLPEFRGNGFAIEAMLKLIEYAFIKLEIPRIIAHIHPENTQGWKVAERIGMKYMGHIQHEDFKSKVMQFSIDKREYDAQRD